MTFKCTNCLWTGEEAVKGRFCLICGDNVMRVTEEPEVKKETEEPEASMTDEPYSAYLMIHSGKSFNIKTGERATFKVGFKKG